MSCRKRVQLSVDCETSAVQQRSSRALHVLRVGEHESGSRIIQRETEAHLAGSGDGGMPAAERCNSSGKLVGAVMAAKKWHHG